MHVNQYLPAPLTIPRSPTLQQAVLLQELKEVERLLKRESSLPLTPAVRVKGLNLDKCSFFSSFTVPLKLSFKCGEGRPDVGVIFKVGLGHSGINTHVVQCYCSGVNVNVQCLYIHTYIHTYICQYMFLSR